MNLPLKIKVFLDNEQTFFTAIPGSQSVYEKIFGTDPAIRSALWKASGRGAINDVLKTLMPNDFWMITSIKRDSGGQYMLYILNKEKVLDDIGFNKVMEHFS